MIMDIYFHDVRGYFPICSKNLILTLSELQTPLNTQMYFRLFKYH